MADYNSAVSLGVNSPDPNQGMNTLSKILSIGSQGLQIQGQKSANKSAAAKATVDTQTATENQNLAKLVSDPVGSGIIDQDGNETQDAKRIILQAAPTTGADHYEKLVAASQKKLDFNKSVNNLRSDERAEFANTVGGAAAGAQSPDDIRDAVTSLVASKKGTAVEGDYQKLANQTLESLDHVTKKNSGAEPPPIGKEPWRQFGLGVQRQILGASGVVGSGGVAAPSNVNMPTATGTQPGTTAPALSGGGFTPTGPVITAPPTIMASPQGPIVKVAPGGGSMTPVPETGGKTNAPPSKLQPLQRPGLNAPAADIANYNARIKQAGDEQQAVSNAANDPQNGVQVSRYRNGQILDLTKVAPTGPGKEIWNHIASQFPGQGADAFQKIGHYLAQNSAAMAGKMGVPNTNMGQETAAAAAGNVTQNPEAIKEITKVNDALNTGFDLYNRGLAKVTNNGSDLSKVPAYKQAFGQNTDVNALRWADANRRNDREEIAQLSKQGPAAIAAWQKKLATLKALVTTGDLP